MLAKFDGKCGACYDPFYEGDNIDYDQFFQKWVHPDCKTEGF
jgi:hypothetical protein